MYGRFAHDSALRRISGDEWAATIDRGWWIVRGPNGGYIAALLVRALGEAVPDRAARSFTVHYLAPPTEGECRVRVTIDRQGRSMVFAGAELWQADRCCAIARYAASNPFPSSHAFVTLTPPDYPAPDWRELGPAPIPMAERYDTVWCEGDDGTAGDAPARVGGWIRFAESEGGGPLDAAAIAAITDAWSPAVFHKLMAPLAVPTVDLTVHYRAPVPPGVDSLAVRFTTTTLHDGFLEEDGELWTPDGTLVAQSRQLAVALPFD
jgi:acyl-coenzyme A thioesterase PaaI-like protein